MSSKVTNSEFAEWVEHLRHVCPPPPRTKVEVRRVETEVLNGFPGDTDKKREKFTILIDKALSNMETQWTLIHEWAHMMDWRPYRPLSHDHGPTWGVHYSEVYQAFYHTR
jgi:hypothetical protein